jgi:hypothetical protein
MGYRKTRSGMLHSIDSTLPVIHRSCRPGVCIRSMACQNAPAGVRRDALCSTDQIHRNTNWIYGDVSVSANR